MTQILHFVTKSAFVAINTEISAIVKTARETTPLKRFRKQEAIQMSTQDRSRSLMMRHSHMVKNRQQSMLTRAAAEVGIDAGDYCTKIQGKMRSDFRTSYDRSGSSMS